MTYAQHYRMRAAQPPQQPQYEQVSQQPEHPFQEQRVYVTRPRDVNVRNVTVPLVLVVTGAASIIFATYVLTSNMADIKYGVQSMKDSLSLYTIKSTESISRIDKEIDALRLSGWSAKDHALWCSQEEVSNPSWKCVSGAQRSGDWPSAHPAE